MLDKKFIGNTFEKITAFSSLPILHFSSYLHDFEKRRFCRLPLSFSFTNPYIKIIKKKETKISGFDHVSKHRRAPTMKRFILKSECPHYTNNTTAVN